MDWHTLDLNVTEDDDLGAPAPATDTASFLEEIIPQGPPQYVEEEGEDKAEDERRKRRRLEDQKDMSVGGGSEDSHPTRTIDRYYDHPLPEHEERVSAVEEVETEEAFEVVDFEVVCPISCFNLSRRKSPEAQEAILKSKSARFRIPAFESQSDSPSVFTVDGTPKPTRSPHIIYVTACNVNMTEGKVTFFFSGRGFRFKHRVEFDFFVQEDQFELPLCEGVLDSRAVRQAVVREADYFSSKPSYDANYKDRHRYELPYEDCGRKSRALFRGRVMQLGDDDDEEASLIVPIDETSTPAPREDERDGTATSTAGKREEEEEEEEDF